MKKFDFIVIGAGVVGAAIAKELSSYGSVIVIERRSSPGMETSRYNSGVVHSGIHLPPTFLKAKLAREGSQLIKKYCELFNIPNREVGMHIVVTANDCFSQIGQLKQFIKLVNRARKQDIKIRLKNNWQIRTVEPSIRCLFGVHIPGVRIIDQTGLLRSLIQNAITNNTTIVCDEEVKVIEPSQNGLLIRTNSDYYFGGYVINAAGLRSDQVAKMVGIDTPQYFYRGEYYEVKPSASVTANGLVYPLPPRHSKGLGIHLTPTTDGRILLGPNTKRVTGPDDYQVDRTPPQSFLRAVHPFLPQLKIEHISWAFSGIRPKITDEPVESDFVIERHPTLPMINLIGIESPGLTASLAIAKYVSNLALD